MPEMRHAGSGPLVITPVPEQANLARVAQVGLKIPLKPGCEPLVRAGKIHLVIQLEGPWVLVRGSDDAPEIVDNQHLGVNHRGLVLINVRSGSQEIAEGPPARSPGQKVIRARSGRDDPNFDPALLDRSHQLIAETMVRQEIGCRDVNAMQRRGYQRLHQHSGGR
jgi:hypothetical protein